ncbi:MAG: sipT 1 [Firmicutes bacterium]|nr:sipT 1 [Bacillota bacterium]
MNWKVRLSDQAVDKMKKLDPIDREMIISYLEQRIEGCKNPRQFGKAFHEKLDNVWRYRVGRFCLVCELENEVVTVYLQGGILMNLVKTIQDWTYNIIIALALAFFINIFIAQHVVVEGHSMDPTLADHDHLLVSKLSHTVKRLPNYDDIVIIDSRVNRERSLKDDLAEPVSKWISSQEYVFVKRVVGKPGDVLEFKGNSLYRNGTKLEEFYILEPMNEVGDRKITVPEGSVFVMGDNRNHSMDSRMIGTIPLDHVLGIMVAKL